ncbi:MAG: magnesium transporter CorA family protein [Patescibacteria group bacterium]
MLSRYTHKKITWIDLESPTQEEVRSLMKEFKIHPLVADEILSPTIRPKVDIYPDYLYLILHFPIIEHRHGERADQEVDFILGKNFIITTHYETIDPLHEFSKLFEVNSIIDKSHVGAHAGFVFFYLLKELYRALGGELDRLSILLERVEKSVFEGHEKEMVEAISHVNRDILNFRQAIRLHGNVLVSFEHASAKIYGDDFGYYIRAAIGEYQKIASALDGHRETISELRETNDSLLTTKQNETIKTFTIMAFITLPLSLIAGLFGMNVEHTPLVGIPGDFFIVMGIMLGTLIALFVYFKRKHWM